MAQQSIRDKTESPSLQAHHASWRLKYAFSSLNVKRKVSHYQSGWNSSARPALQLKRGSLRGKILSSLRVNAYVSGQARDTPAIPALGSWRQENQENQEFEIILAAQRAPGLSGLSIQTTLSHENNRSFANSRRKPDV